MKIARFSVQGGPPRIGAVVGSEIRTLDALGVGDDVVAAALIDPGRRDQVASEGKTIHLDDLDLLAPVPRPPKFLAIGLNYADHISEGGRSAPDFPKFFNKQSTCVNHPNAGVPIPFDSPDTVDYEGELGLVIGQRCRRVSRSDAPGVVAGYLAINDVSVRDWQKRSPTMWLGKSWDGHGPMGPWLVTADELPDPHGLSMKTYVNGELRQDTTTDQMVFDCWEQIKVMSSVCTLEPGDVISTGTSSGVGTWFDPPKYLADGDVVRIEIERIGYLENVFYDEVGPASA